MAQAKKNWQIYNPEQEPGDHCRNLPDAPPWRQFDGVPDPKYKSAEASPKVAGRGAGFRLDKEGAMARMINAALCLRRPLLVTGSPGTGKSSLIHAVAHQLQLGDVLKWPITSRSTLQQGLYQYDAIGRLQAAQLLMLNKTRAAKAPDIGQFITLGPLGTALIPSRRPRALLIDEIDKSDLDLPNDLLHVFEEGEFTIPELRRMKERTIAVNDHDGRKFTVREGLIRCLEFPLVVMTSNGERDFPAPFLRRCLRLDMKSPGEDMLRQIVASRLEDPAAANRADDLIKKFVTQHSKRALATDQLLNAVYLLKTDLGVPPGGDDYDELLDALYRELISEPVR